MKNQRLNIAMAGWGTGGHVFPIRSLLETLLSTPSYASQVDNIYRFGASNSLEQQVSTPFIKEGQAGGIHFQPLLSGKFRREKSFSAFLKNARDGILFLIWFFQSLRYLHRYHIDVVFCKGGYVALPVVFAAHVLRLNLIVHESDVHPWLVNRIASRYASKVFTGFDNVLPPSITVGQILSDDIIPLTKGDKGSSTKQKTNATPIASHLIKEGYPTVFVMWGSQGSRTLYETFAHLLQTNPTIATSFIFFISLGKRNEHLKSLFPQKNVHTFDFLTQQEMGELYQISDICLARGGTTSLAEQKLFNIKSLIVPIPRTHDQMDNAKRFVHHHDDLLLDQTSPTFLTEMETAFLSLLHYKKPALHHDLSTEIQQAKKLIWEAILE